jgi:hypothetical protein
MEGEVSKKDDKREARAKEGICHICGYDCHDKESLQRHLEWAHKNAGTAVKP